MPRQTKLSIVPDSPMLGVEASRCHDVSHQLAIKAIKAKFTSADWSVWTYLLMLTSSSTPSVKEIASSVGISEKQASRSIQKIGEMGFLDERLTEFYKKAKYSNPEHQVRDALKQQLGGKTEVVTPSGRIDLLTETQIIEVKRITDWKSALGQILAYSSFYPSHQKRLHLFGTQSQEGLIADIESACLPFSVLVTFQAVEE